jgi:hypothetical protein
MLGSALGLPGLACGRFDFKGTTDVELELRSFVMNLEVPLPPAGMPLSDRLGQILDALRQRARAALTVLGRVDRLNRQPRKKTSGPGPSRR